MELQVGVKILLKNKEGNFLVLRRNPEKYSEVHKLLDIPGGRIEPGSTLMQNLQREILEETGLVLSGEPKLIAAQDILRPKRHVVRLTYLGEAEGEIKISDEHSEFIWISKKEMMGQEGLDPYLEEVLQKFL
ncbi:NUDIX domain-containing protein [Candidatus Nomurabacteria bacterium]|nr:NUDIX domain-containing protein [Candidatus Nomurabacteria bacterium]